MMASENGHTETVSILLQNGAHVNIQNNDGWTPLMMASQNGHTETVLILLQNGAHTNIQDNETTALHFTSKYNQISIAKLILNQKTHVIDVQDFLGRTPLMIASSCEMYWKQEHELTSAISRTTHHFIFHLIKYRCQKGLALCMGVHWTLQSSQVMWR